MVERVRLTNEGLVCIDDEGERVVEYESIVLTNFEPYRLKEDEELDRKRLGKRAKKRLEELAKERGADFVAVGIGSGPWGRLCYFYKYGVKKDAPERESGRNIVKKKTAKKKLVEKRGVAPIYCIMDLNSVRTQRHKRVDLDIADIIAMGLPKITGDRAHKTAREMGARYFVLDKFKIYSNEKRYVFFRKKE